MQGQLLSAPASPNRSRNYERSPLLKRTTSQAAEEWVNTLKRKSAILSDVISGRNHSANDSIGIYEAEEQEGEDDVGGRAAEFSSHYEEGDDASSTRRSVISPIFR